MKCFHLKGACCARRFCTKGAKRVPCGVERRFAAGKRFSIVFKNFSKIRRFVAASQKKKGEQENGIT
jgi:hypothetical protein